jgi:hypothetical protein
MSQQTNGEYPMNDTAGHWVSNSTPAVTARAPHRCGNPGAIIEWVHAYATEEGGYQRVRLDRGEHPSGAWYEIGQGSGEVGIRSNGERWRTNQDLSRAMTNELRNLLHDNIEAAETAATGPLRSGLSILSPRVEARMGPVRYLTALKFELEACWTALLDAERRANPLQQVRIRPGQESIEMTTWEGHSIKLTPCGHAPDQGCYQCCDRCNHDAHTCGGCGNPVPHFAGGSCASCRADESDLESQS